MTLSDDAWVVRNGIMAGGAAGVLENIEAAVEDGDGPVLSVHCLAGHPGEPPDSVLRRLCQTAEIRNRQIRVTTAGALRERGFELALDTSDGQASTHHHVSFVGRIDLERAAEFVACFAEPVPNPAKLSQ